MFEKIAYYYSKEKHNLKLKWPDVLFWQASSNINDYLMKLSATLLLLVATTTTAAPTTAARCIRLLV